MNKLQKEVLLAQVRALRSTVEGITLQLKALERQLADDEDDGMKHSALFSGALQSKPPTNPETLAARGELPRVTPAKSKLAALASSGADLMALVGKEVTLVMDDDEVEEIIAPPPVPHAGSPVVVGESFDDWWQERLGGPKKEKP